jgi:methylthioribose-1-phosphate isomerase
MLPNPLRTIWLNEKQEVQIINQTLLPHELHVETLHNLEDVFQAIVQMIVRGAPLIGATASYGLWMACRDASEALLDHEIEKAAEYLRSSRPTAVNLFVCIDRMMEAINSAKGKEEKTRIALETAHNIVAEDIEICRMIGVHGLPLIEEISKRKGGETVNILTHCNAGMMGCIRWGTITSPIYQAMEKGIKVHVWVDETRPRNQGSNLTAWELSQHKVPHTLIVDNTGGHLMQHGMVDIVFVGTDRTTRQGDVANKIGTYLKALAAKDNNVPFYVALPSTTIDWTINDGLKEIPIEERNQDEVKYFQGLNSAGVIDKVLICPPTTPAANYGFDVTPARLVSGLITERGICAATEKGLTGLFPEMT